MDPQDLSLAALVTSLASRKLDASPSSSRARVIQKATELLVSETPKAREELATSLNGT